MTKPTVDEHHRHIAELLMSVLTDRPTETVALDDALDRVTAAAIPSPVDLPMFRNSQMDGFAVQTADLPGTLPIVGEIAARPGAPAELAPGTAVRIMTGAPLPAGADAVVPVEDTVVEGDLVTIAHTRSVGEYVRERGSDLRSGEHLLPAGRLLAPRHLAVLAAAGLNTVVVRTKIRVAIITTGSELIEPGATPTPGQVFDSNGTALAAAVRQTGAVVAFRRHVVDEIADMLDALSTAATSAELIITSGGISMGDHEVVREALEPLGAEVISIAMQPGGPQATATFEGVPVVCFPGNPVSTQLSFEVFVAGLLRAAAGRRPGRFAPRILTTAVRSVEGKRQFLRGKARADGRVEVVSGASSHLVAGLAASDLLIDVPPDVTSLEAGAEVLTWEL
ncbi:MAG: gephyrin-like molybdotransferase Glp [Rhodoglobus sp.]